MSGKKVLSVAEIARELELPESTVHYWKNRFAQHLPSVGRGRQKRFRPEAIDIFATISRLLKEGHTARDVMDQLSQNYPIQADPFPQSTEISPLQIAGGGMEPVMKMASAIGMEIAKSVNDGIRSVMSNADNQDVTGLRQELENTLTQISGTREETEQLKQENSALKEKLHVMEQEMIRLRKDRREMEKYLLDKIKAVAT